MASATVAWAQSIAAGDFCSLQERQKGGLVKGMKPIITEYGWRISVMTDKQTGQMGVIM